MSILTDIVEETRRSIPRRKALYPVNRLDARIRTLPRTLDFAAALRHNELAIIAEIKQASPSKGQLREHLEPGDIAKQYQDGGAHAISVLTESVYFKGSINHLKTVRQHTQIPLLLKDFVVDSYQLYEARACGADAVLLIATVLDASELRDFLLLAHELDLNCLVEIYEESELEKIDWDLIRILGVNNRDLHTFSVDINHSLQILTHCPQHIVRVSESGLKTASQLVHLWRHGIDAVLIGETFMRANNPGHALSRMRAAVRQELDTS